MKNSSENHRLRTENNPLAEKVNVTGNGYRLDHDLSPEEAARSIWAQWVTIKKLVNCQNFKVR